MNELLFRAQDYYAQGRMSDALDILEMLLRDEPQNREARDMYNKLNREYSIVGKHATQQKVEDSLYPQQQEIKMADNKSQEKKLEKQATNKMWQNILRILKESSPVQAFQQTYESYPKDIAGKPQPLGLHVQKAVEKGTTFEDPTAKRPDIFRRMGGLLSGVGEHVGEGLYDVGKGALGTGAGLIALLKGLGGSTLEAGRRGIGEVYDPDFQEFLRKIPVLGNLAMAEDEARQKYMQFLNQYLSRE